MNYLFEVWKLLKKCSWTKLNVALKGTVVTLLILISTTGVYWLLDRIYQLVLQKG